MHAEQTEILCKALAEEVRSQCGEQLDYVVGPALAVSYPPMKHRGILGVPNIWVEREDGVFKLRRFEIEQGAKVVIIEDIVTTGLSIRETVDVAQKPRCRSSGRRVPG